MFPLGSIRNEWADKYCVDSTDTAADDDTVSKDAFEAILPGSTSLYEKRRKEVQPCEHGLIPLDQVDDDQAAENRCGGAFVSYCTFPRSQSLFLCPVAIPHAAHNMADYFIYASDAMHPYQSSQKVARASVSQRLDPDGTRSQRARGFSALRRPHFTPPVV